jgi:predicted dehydrogenase
VSKISNPDLVKLNKDYAANHIQRHNMAEFRAPKLNTVRVGVIGLGNRGPNHLKALVQIENVEIRAICDKTPEQIERGLAWVEDTDHSPEIYTGGEDEWKKLCEQKDLDLIFVCSPIPLHAEMSIYAMQQGKHVACEVAAAWKMEDCWELIKTSEQTRKHFMMLENYSYMNFHLQTIMMAKDGFFGDIVHGEGAYNTSKVANCLGQKGGDSFGKGIYTDWWWLKAFAEHRGNIYPTHGLGPIAQLMDINRGDRFDYMVSMESNDFNYGPHARELAELDPSTYEPFTKLEYRGNMSTSLIRTVKGRTIVFQHDAHTPQPHNLIHGVYGTKGCALFDPEPPRISTGGGWVKPEECTEIRERYTPEITKRLGAKANGHGHGGSDFRMDWHLIDCLRNGLPLPQDVYDAASWSATVPLSAWSVLNESTSIKVPDFTAGAWETNSRNMDINLENGGGNTKVLPPSKAGMEFDDELAGQWARDHEMREGSS